MAPKKQGSGKARKAPKQGKPGAPDLGRIAMTFADLLLNAAEWSLPRAQKSQALKEQMGKLGLTPAQQVLCDRVHQLVQPLNKKQSYRPGDGTVAEGLGLLVGLAFGLQENLVEISVDAVKAGHGLIRAINEGIDRCETATRKPEKTTPAKKAVKTRKSPASRGTGKAPATGEIFQFKITLLETRPAIWRRIQVRDCTFNRFHHHIQAAMGWTNSHLHQFELGGQYIANSRHMNMGPLEFDGLDGTQVTLGLLLPAVGKKASFLYEYDMGDSWNHQVTLEKRFEPEAGVKYPRCVEGENACPPEDCGGVWGYYEMLEAVKNPGHAMHKEYREWLGKNYDPARFDPVRATREMGKKPVEL